MIQPENHDLFMRTRWLAAELGQPLDGLGEHAGIRVGVHLLECPGVAGVPEHLPSCSPLMAHAVAKSVPAGVGRDCLGDSCPFGCS